MSPTTEAGRRSPIEALRHRRYGALSTQRAQHRTSAFVYGNITVLGAVVAVTHEAIDHGSAVIAVGGTALTTFVAHVVADQVADRIRPVTADAPSRPPDTIPAELRDAVPIATSALWPMIALLLGTIGLLSAPVAQVVAASWIVVRLAATGVIVERVSGRRASAAAFWSGVGLAILSAVIAFGKALLTH